MKKILLLFAISIASIGIAQEHRLETLEAENVTIGEVQTLYDFVNDIVKNPKLLNKQPLYPEQFFKAVPDSVALEFVEVSSYAELSKEDKDFWIRKIDAAKLLMTRLSKYETVYISYMSIEEYDDDYSPGLIKCEIIFQVEDHLGGEHHLWEYYTNFSFYRSGSKFILVFLDPED